MKPVGKARRDFLRDGYAVVEGVFSSAECAMLAREVARLTALTDEQSPGDIARIRWLAARQRGGVSREEAGEQVFMLGDLTRYSTRLIPVVADPRVMALVTAVLGRPRPRYHFSNITQKPPRVGPRVGPHRDLTNRLVTMTAARYCRTAICIDGMGVRNGGMVFVAGSHHIADARVRRHPRRKVRLRRAPDAVRCRPGAVVLFSPKVIHGSVFNRSAGPRRNLVVQYGAPYQKLIASSVERWTGRPASDMRSWKG